MILRIPDYYEEFSCIADQCRDSCCIGWEIDIDEASMDYYKTVEGAFGERLKNEIYQSDDGEYRFCLKEKNRCTMLNDKNLCDLYTALGEPALCEVCTDYPRVSTFYGNVMQRSLGISCEEVGRILFSRDEPVTFVDRHMEDSFESDEEESTEMDSDADEKCNTEEWCEVCECLEECDDDEESRILMLEGMQHQMLSILQDRRRDIRERMGSVLCIAGKIDERKYVLSERHSYVDFDERFRVFEEMEAKDGEWVSQVERMRKTMTEHSYEEHLHTYMQSKDYCQNDYEQLMVYFIFRYFMTSVYNYGEESYVRMAVIFTLVIRDMDALRYFENGGHFTLEDRIDTARIFSKEVEHLEDNLALIREEMLFDDVYSVERLLAQI